jgi:hypothetical protein
MSDWEIHAPDDATMMAAANAIGLTANSGLMTGGVSRRGNVAWTLNYYGTKLVPTGNTITNPRGMEVPEMAAANGVYAILRWEGDARLLPAIPSGAPITIIPLPADSPYKFA